MKMVRVVPALRSASEKWWAGSPLRAKFQSRLVHEFFTVKIANRPRRMRLLLGW